MDGGPFLTWTDLQFVVVPRGHSFNINNGKKTVRDLSHHQSSFAEQDPP